MIHRSTHAIFKVSLGSVRQSNRLSKHSFRFCPAATGPCLQSSSKGCFKHFPNNSVTVSGRNMNLGPISKSGHPKRCSGKLLDYHTSGSLSLRDKKSLSWYPGTLSSRAKATCPPVGPSNVSFPRVILGENDCFNGTTLLSDAHVACTCQSRLSAPLQQDQITVEVYVLTHMLVATPGKMKRRKRTAKALHSTPVKRSLLLRLLSTVSLLFCLVVLAKAESASCFQTNTVQWSGNLDE